MAREVYRTSRFERGGIPQGLLRDHSLKAGVHGELRVLEGSLVFVDASGRHPLRAGETHPIAPEALHHLEEADDAAVEIAFSREVS